MRLILSPKELSSPNLNRVQSASSFSGHPFWFSSSIIISATHGLPSLIAYMADESPLFFWGITPHISSASIVGISNSSIDSISVVYDDSLILPFNMKSRLLLSCPTIYWQRSFMILSSLYSNPSIRKTVLCCSPKFSTISLILYTFL